MGTSTDAIIYFGFDIYDPEEAENKLFGKIPEDDYELEKVFNQEKLQWVKDIGVEFDYHCSSEFPNWYIYVKESRVIAYRGHPKELDLQTDPLVIYEWVSNLEKACEVLGIDFQTRWCKFRLASYWG